MVAFFPSDEARNFDRPATRAAVRALEFYTELERDNRSGKMKPVDYVRIAKRGRSDHITVHRMRDIAPPDASTLENPERMPVNPLLWDAIGNDYTKWKHGNAAPETGTSIDAWSGVSKSLASVMKTHGVRTVEEVAALTDADCARIGPGTMQSRTAARRFVEIAQAHGNAEAFMAQRDAEAERMKAEIDALREQLQELAAAAQEAPAPAKRARG